MSYDDDDDEEKRRWISAAARDWARAPLLRAVSAATAPAWPPELRRAAPGTKGAERTGGRRRGGPTLGGGCGCGPHLAAPLLRPLDLRRCRPRRHLLAVDPPWREQGGCAPRLAVPLLRRRRGLPKGRAAPPHRRLRGGAVGGRRRP
jgi:hypothetical protein